MEVGLAVDALLALSHAPIRKCRVVPLKLSSITQGLIVFKRYGRGTFHVFSRADEVPAQLYEPSS
jgi:hypothetical protein